MDDDKLKMLKDIITKIEQKKATIYNENIYFLFNLS